MKWFIPLLALSFSVNASGTCDQLKSFAESAMKNRKADVNIKLVIKAVNSSSLRKPLTTIVMDAYTTKNTDLESFGEKWEAICKMATSGKF